MANVSMAGVYAIEFGLVTWPGFGGGEQQPTAQQDGQSGEQWYGSDRVEPVDQRGLDFTGRVDDRIVCLAVGSARREPLPSDLDVSQTSNSGGAQRALNAAILPNWCGS